MENTETQDSNALTDDKSAEDRNTDAWAVLIIFSALVFGALHIFVVLNGLPPIWVIGNIVWAAITGLFYGYVTLKTDSLLPAMIVHYLANLFVAAITAYVQANASVSAVTVYGVLFTFGIIPTILMILWTRFFITHWPGLQKL